MKVRLSGTRAECEALTRALPAHLEGLALVVEVSGFYPNRGGGVLGRVYVELRLTATEHPTEGDTRC